MGRIGRGRVVTGNASSGGLAMLMLRVAGATIRGLAMLRVLTRARIIRVLRGRMLKQTLFQSKGGVLLRKKLA